MASIIGGSNERSSGSAFEIRQTPFMKRLSASFKDQLGFSSSDSSSEFTPTKRDSKSSERGARALLPKATSMPSEVIMRAKLDASSPDDIHHCLSDDVHKPTTPPGNATRLKPTASAEQPFSLSRIPRIGLRRATREATTTVDAKSPKKSAPQLCSSTTTGGVASNSHHSAQVTELEARVAAAEEVAKNAIAAAEGWRVMALQAMEVHKNSTLSQMEMESPHKSSTSLTTSSTLSFLDESAMVAGEKLLHCGCCSSGGIKPSQNMLYALGCCADGFVDVRNVSGGGGGGEAKHFSALDTAPIKATPQHCRTTFDLHAHPHSPPQPPKTPPMDWSSTWYQPAYLSDDSLEPAMSWLEQRQPGPNNSNDSLDFAPRTPDKEVIANSVGSHEGGRTASSRTPTNVDRGTICLGSSATRRPRSRMQNDSGLDLNSNPIASIASNAVIQPGSQLSICASYHDTAVQANLGVEEKGGLTQKTSAAPKPAATSIGVQANCPLPRIPTASLATQTAPHTSAHAEVQTDPLSEVPPTCTAGSTSGTTPAVHPSLSPEVRLQQQEANIKLVQAEMTKVQQLHGVTETQRREYTARYAFCVLDEDHDGFIRTDQVALLDMFQPWSPRILSAALASWRSTPTYKGYLMEDDFVSFVHTADERSTRDSVRFWFNFIDVDGDGLIGPEDAKWCYDAVKETQTVYVISFHNLWNQLVDMVNPKAGKRGFSCSELLRCKLASGVTGLLLNHRNMLTQRSTLEWNKTDTSM